VDLVDPGSMVYELGTGENIFSWHVSNGVCPESADQVSITVLQMIVPTVITPNGDGLNDFFIINGIEQFEESELIVSNRWGEVVYEEKPYTNSWNGLDRNGRELPEETYYIVLKISDNDIRKGYVVILR
jgi:gliding motility-associated-like protein